MPHTPLSQLRPEHFPKLGDEEHAFNSYDEDSDENEAQDQFTVDANTTLI